MYRGYSLCCTEVMVSMALKVATNLLMIYSVMNVEMNLIFDDDSDEDDIIIKQRYELIGKVKEKNHIMNWLDQYILT